MNRGKAVLSWVLPLGLALLTGCVSPERQRGWVPALQEGDTASDFKYVDVDGEERASGSLFGDFTVLLFSKCDGDMHRPAAKEVEDILNENRRAHRVVVTGVDVHWSESGCPQRSTCHVVDADVHLASLCDGAGTVRRLYGVRGEDSLLVIDSRSKVIASAPRANTRVLREKLRKNVKELQEERMREEEFSR